MATADQAHAAERGQLEQGLAALSLDAPPGAVDMLLTYTAELRKWNRGYNLVSAADLPAFVHRHLLDSLAILPWVATGQLLDVGTGAGLPGLPLAIVDPALHCMLLDSAGKKTRFLGHVKRQLGLPNVEIVYMRVGDFQSDQPFDTITSRAFASLVDFARAVRHLCGPDTRLLAMKGRHPADELEALPSWAHVYEVERIDVPGLQQTRHLVMMGVSPAGSVQA